MKIQIPFRGYLVSSSVSPILAHEYVSVTLNRSVERDMQFLFKSQT